MPNETDTTVFERGKGVIARHGNKVFNGLSAGALVFLYAEFVRKDDYREHCRQCELYALKSTIEREFDQQRQDCKDARAALWRRTADLESKIDRPFHSPKDTVP